MIRRVAPVCLLLLCLPGLLRGGSPGTFLGVVVSAPGAAKDGWIYVQAKNGMVRRVEISSAKVVYADEMPRSKRKASPKRALQPGVEVRVTAEQDASGEWRANRIEIVTEAGENSPRSTPDDDDAAPVPEEEDVDA